MNWYERNSEMKMMLTCEMLHRATMGCIEGPVFLRIFKRTQPLVDGAIGVCKALEGRETLEFQHHPHYD